MGTDLARAARQGACKLPFTLRGWLGNGIGSSACEFILVGTDLARTMRQSACELPQKLGEWLGNAIFSWVNDPAMDKQFASRRCSRLAAVIAFSDSAASLPTDGCRGLQQIVSGIPDPGACVLLKIASELEDSQARTWANPCKHVQVFEFS